MKKSNSRPAAPPKAFPFDRLPVELKFEIVRRAMPQGLLLRPLPTIAHHEGRDTEHDEVLLTDKLIKAYHEELQTRDWSRYGLPTSLAHVNKFFANEARTFFLNRVPLIFTVNTLGVHFLATIIRRFTTFRSHLEYENVYYVRQMRTFQLNIDTDPWSYKAKGGSLELKHGQTPAKADLVEFKERLRLISDILMLNSDIRQLIVKVPCLCNCIRVDTAAKGESDVLDMLSPLKRLRAQKPVIFRTTHDNEQCVDRECNKYIKRHFVTTLETRLGRLTGEALSDKEAAWKRIKSLERPQSTGNNTSVEHGLTKLWNYLEFRPEKFWARAQSEEQWISDLIQEEAGVRARRMEEDANRNWVSKSGRGPHPGY
ncbi:MAG: hypothetical protein Q9222_002647 [Ikaeria aurantiellina]